MEDFDEHAYWYDWGFRRGVILKCSGMKKPNRKDWSEAAKDGFRDGWKNNKRRI